MPGEKIPQELADAQRQQDISDAYVPQNAADAKIKQDADDARKSDYQRSLEYHNVTSEGINAAGWRAGQGNPGDATLDYLGYETPQAWVNKHSNAEIGEFVARSPTDFLFDNIPTTNGVVGAVPVAAQNVLYAVLDGTDHAINNGKDKIVNALRGKSNDSATDNQSAQTNGEQVDQNGVVRPSVPVLARKLEPGNSPG